MTVNRSRSMQRMQIFPVASLVILVLILSGCGDSVPTVPPPAQPPPLNPPPGSGFVTQTTFSNTSATAGLNHRFSIADVAATSDPAKMGGGVAAADFDQDGDIDLYFVGGDGAANALFRNDGGNQYSEIAASLNLDAVHMGSGAAFADIDGDGDLDIFVGSVEGDPFYLFRRDGDRYTDVTQISGITITANNTISAGFADYDMDGDLDLFLAHWGNPPQADTETLWQNNGDGTFTNASIQSEIAAQIIGPKGELSGFFDYSFAPVFADIDNDGDPDILLASDFGSSKIFKNNGDGSFLDITDRDVIIDRNGMGSSAGDYDNDGDMDWFVTSIYESSGLPEANFGNRLYRNLGDGTFEDVTDESGVANGGWGWASCMQDFDNDGDLDIFHVNGWDRVDPREAGGPDDFTDDQVRYFESQGDGTFVESATEAGLIDTGQGRGAACFDSDRDGDIDIVITNNQDVRSVVFYRNELANDNHYLALKLIGSGLNTAAIGARIEVTDGNLTQIREISAGNNFVSQSPAEAHFGLGAIQNVDVTVNWPDGTQSRLLNEAVDRLLIITQP